MCKQSALHWHWGWDNLLSQAKWSLVTLCTHHKQLLVEITEGISHGMWRCWSHVLMLGLIIPSILTRPPHVLPEQKHGQKICAWPFLLIKQ